MRIRSQTRKKTSDVIGYSQGRLTVSAAIDEKDGHASRFLCMCSCGKDKVISWESISAGSCSCGCIRNEAGRLNKTHGMSETRVFSIWCGMIGRCKGTNPASIVYYKNGISVCERWMSFENFYQDMGDPPSANHSIDRRESTGNYDPSNCRWATKKEQAGNTKRTVLVELNGVTMVASDAARILGISHHTVISRHRKGIPIDKQKHVPVGVVFCKDKNRWVARVKIKGKQIYLGSFMSREEAIAGREKKLKEMQ